MTAERKICPNSLFSKEVEGKIRGIDTLLLDLDGSLFPGPPELGFFLNAIKEAVDIIPCTTRSWGEMMVEEYPGKETLTKTQVGVYEAGLVVKMGERLILLCSRKDLEKLKTLKEIVKANIRFVGPRRESLFELEKDPTCSFPWGYLQSCLGEEYIRRRCVPLTIPPYLNQYSLVIWPSGSARKCPKERNFYQICFFLDGLKAAKGKLFENMSILVGDESVVVRPKSPNGEEITKLTGVKFLQSRGIISPKKTLFIGDDDRLDLPVTSYIKVREGVVIVPSNADKEIKTLADFVAPGFAGEAILPVLEEIKKLKC